MTQGHRRTRHAAGVFVAACSALVFGLAGAGSATAATTPTWLCKPGLANNPCTPGLRTTQVSPTGQNLKTFTPSSVKRPKVDCFYVYPTVSDQKAPQATKHIDPEERSIALYQAARYSSLCRIYAPMYRQITLQGLLNPASVTQKMRDTGYGDVRDAWRYYIKHYNKGRGVILISHSQGTFVLRTLVAKEIDKSAQLRKQLIAGVLLGGNVLVKKGKDVGGDFQHVRACRSATQLGCVIAFSTFNETPPANSLFGRTGARFGTGDPKGTEVLCTNPAALGGGSAPLNSVLPSAPFAPGTTIGALTTQIGFPPITAKTPWAEADGLYTGACSAEGGAHVLRINGTTPDAPVLRPLADATWGLHLTDANIALGNIITLVGGQAKAYLAKARTTR